MARRIPHPLTARPGFSFVELLFAVIILGIGFILIAAMFPVAIRQTQLTGDETVAASSARAAAAEVGLAAGRLTIGGTPFGIPATDLIATTAGATDQPLITRPAVTAEVATRRPALPSAVDGSVLSRGKVLSFNDDRITGGAGSPREALWNAVAGNLINTADPRSAYVLLFKRDQTYTNLTGGPVAIDAPSTADVRRTPGPVQLFVFGVQVRNRTTYRADVDLDRPATNTPATLEPKPIFVSIEHANAAGPLLRMTNVPAGGSDPHTELSGVSAGANAVAAAGEGAFVIISDDRVAGVDNGRANGRVYRLGVERTDVAGPGQRAFLLAPGFQTQDATENLGTGGPPLAPSAVAWLVGRATLNPTAAWNATTNPYEGFVQDVAAYTTFLDVD